MRRIDLPPGPGHAAAFPESFGRRFAIFADAEEEFDWRLPFDRAATSTRAVAALPAANARLIARGVTPTYLADWPVIDNADSGAILRALADAGECDVGAQLHPWVTPPHEEAVTPRNSFAGNLPRALEEAKIAALTARIAEVIGRPPVAYRAGRYGVGPATAELLAAAGYALDVSVRTLFDYSAEGGPDFRRHPAAPYWLGPGLLEAPLSVALVGPLAFAGWLPETPLLRGLFARARLLNRVALTPEGMPLAEAKAAIRAMLARGARFFSLAFHTPSLVPGHTPYVRDAADLDRFWRWWEEVLDLFGAAGVTPVRPGEIVAAAGAGLPAAAPLR